MTVRRPPAEKKRELNLEAELAELQRTNPEVREAHRRLRRTTADLTSGSFADREERIARFRYEADRIYREAEEKDRDA